MNKISNNDDNLRPSESVKTNIQENLRQSKKDLRKKPQGMRRLQTSVKNKLIQHKQSLKFTVKMNEDQYADAAKEEALAEGAQRQFRICDEETGKWNEMKLCCPNEDLGRFGAGVQLYFQFLKNFALLFYFLFLIALIPIYLNYRQNGFNSGRTGNIISKMSIGNMKRPVGSGLNLTNVSLYNKTGLIKLEQDFNSELDDQWKRVGWVQFFDFLIMGIFFGYYVYYRWKTSKISKEIEQENYTAGDYSIFVKGFPETGVTEQEIEKFFGQFGKVVDVQFARKYKNTLYYFQKLQKIYHKERNESVRMIKRMVKGKKKKKVNKYRKRRQKQESKVLKHLENKFFKKYNIKTIEDFPVAGAYVVFNKLEDKVKVWKLYKSYHKVNPWKKFFCNQKINKNIVIPTEHIFREKILFTVEDAEEPVNVNWENFDVTKKEKICRRLGMYLVVLLVMFISFLLLLYINAFAKKGTVICSNTEQDYKTNISSESIQAAKNDTSIDVKCFCKQQSIMDVYKDTPKGLRDYCFQHLKETAWSAVLAAGGGLLAVVVNLSLKALLNKLQKNLRAKYVSEEQQNQFFSIFICLFINIAYIPIIVMSRVQINNEHYMPTILLTQFIPYVNDEKNGIIYKNKGYYTNDFNKQFYGDVGMQYFSFFVIQVFIPQIFFIFIPFFWKKIRDFKLKRALTQSDAIKCCTPPEFKLPQRYGEALSILFAAFMFSTGMPVLLLFGGLCMTSRYLVDKYDCLRVFSRPNYVDSSLNVITLKWLPAMLYNHVFFAILMLSTPTLFPQHLTDQDYDGYFFTGPKGHKDWGFRFWTKNTRLHSIVFIFIIIIFLMDNIIYGIVKTYFIDLIRDDPTCDVVSMELYSEKQGTYTEEKERLKKSCGLVSYNIAKNHEYKELYFAIIDFLKSRAKHKIVIKEQ